MTTVGRAAPRLRGHGFDIGLAPRWEGRIFQRPPVTSVAPSSGHRATATRAEATYPVLHLANFALPAERGDHGSGAVERMGRAHVFVAVLEFGPECLGTALFAASGLPRPRPGDFAPNALQRRLPGQAGFQSFGTLAHRPLALYVVIGAAKDAVALGAEANDALDRMVVTAR